MREPLVEQRLDLWDVHVCMRAESVHVGEYLQIVDEVTILLILTHREGEDTWLVLLQVGCGSVEDIDQLSHVPRLDATMRRYEDGRALQTGAILLDKPSNGPSKGEIGVESFHCLLNMAVEPSVNVSFEGGSLVVAAYPGHELVLSLRDAHVDVRIEGFHAGEPLDVMHQHGVVRVRNTEERLKLRDGGQQVVCSSLVVRLVSIELACGDAALGDDDDGLTLLLARIKMTT